MPLRNGHVNTIFPPLFRQTVRPGFVRKRFNTHDDDFLDIDWLEQGKKRLAILCHGLEGSSDSQYIHGTARLLYEGGWDIAAINYRSCSGEMNKQLHLYHSGATVDLHTVVEAITGAYTTVALVGFSLGGNLVLKYTNDGLYTLSDKIKVVVAVSVPMDLAGSAVALLRRQNIIYQRRFLKSLRVKVLEKHRQYPEEVPLADLQRVNNLRDFDDYFTAPIHGFADAADYYAKCSSLPFLHHVQLPTLVINAQDDPFLSETCFPVAMAKASEALHLLMPRYGGHVGFSLPGETFYWEEQQILNFVEQSG